MLYIVLVHLKPTVPNNIYGYKFTTRAAV